MDFSASSCSILDQKQNNYYTSNHRKLTESNEPSKRRKLGADSVPCDSPIPTKSSFSLLPISWWKETCRYLTQRDLKHLRLVCRLMRTNATVWIWKQWIPFEYCYSYQDNIRRLGWTDSSPVFGVYVKTRVCLNERVFNSLPTDLFALDLSRIYPTPFQTEYLKYLPPNLKVLILHFTHYDPDWPDQVEPVSEETICKVLQMFPNLYITFDRKYTLLYWAAGRGHERLVQMLLNNPMYSDLINHGNGMYEETPICVAARCKNMSIVQCLINNGADVEKPCTDGCNALTCAYYMWDYPMLSFLSQYSKNIGTIENNGTIGNPGVYAIGNIGNNIASSDDLDQTTPPYIS